MNPNVPRPSDLYTPDSGEDAVKELVRFWSVPVRAGRRLRIDAVLGPHVIQPPPGPVANREIQPPEIERRPMIRLSFLELGVGLQDVAGGGSRPHQPRRAVQLDAVNLKEQLRTCIRGQQRQQSQRQGQNTWARWSHPRSSRAADRDLPRRGAWVTTAGCHPRTVEN